MRVLLGAHPPEPPPGANHCIVGSRTNCTGRWLGIVGISSCVLIGRLPFNVTSKCDVGDPNKLFWKCLVTFRKGHVQLVVKHRHETVQRRHPIFGGIVLFSSLFEKNFIFLDQQCVITPSKHRFLSKVVSFDPVVVGRRRHAFVVPDEREMYSYIQLVVSFVLGTIFTDRFQGPQPFSIRLAILIPRSRISLKSWTIPFSCIPLFKRKTCP